MSSSPPQLSPEPSLEHNFTVDHSRTGAAAATDGKVDNSQHHQRIGSQHQRGRNTAGPSAYSSAQVPVDLNSRLTSAEESPQLLHRKWVLSYHKKVQQHRIQVMERTREYGRERDELQKAMDAISQSLAAAAECDPPAAEHICAVVLQFGRLREVLSNITLVEEKLRQQEKHLLEEEQQLGSIFGDFLKVENDPLLHHFRLENSGAHASGKIAVDCGSEVPLSFATPSRSGLEAPSETSESEIRKGEKRIQELRGLYAMGPTVDEQVRPELAQQEEHQKRIVDRYRKNKQLATMDWLLYRLPPHIDMPPDEVAPSLLDSIDFDLEQNQAESHLPYIPSIDMEQLEAPTSQSHLPSAAQSTLVKGFDKGPILADLEDDRPHVKYTLRERKLRGGRSAVASRKHTLSKTLAEGALAPSKSILNASEKGFGQSAGKGKRQNPNKKRPNG